EADAGPGAADVVRRPPPTAVRPVAGLRGRPRTGGGFAVAWEDRGVREQRIQLADSRWRSVGLIRGQLRYPEERKPGPVSGLGLGRPRRRTLPVGIVKELGRQWPILSRIVARPHPGMRN